MQQKQDSQGGKPSSILGKVGRIASGVCVLLSSASVDAFSCYAAVHLCLHAFKNKC